MADKPPEVPVSPAAAGPVRVSVEAVKGARLSGRDWAVGVIAGMASYLDAAAIASVAISLAIWQRHFGLGPWQTGMLSSGLLLSFAAGSLIGGWLGDRFGRVRMLGIDIAVFVVGAVGLLVARDGTTLVLAAVVVGLAAGADLPTSLAAVSELVPAHARDRLIGLTQVLWILGILGSFALGFAVSGLGYLGTQILMAHLVLLGVATWWLRTRLPAPARPPTTGLLRGLDLRALSDRSVVGDLLLLTGFILSWNIASTTLGSFGTYFLVTVTGLTQTTATGLVLVTFPLSLLMATVFVRLADTPWRHRLFVVGACCQIAAFGVGAVTGGVLVWGMVLLVALYSLSNTFAGEAAYKVWTQQLFPAELRSTATGIGIGAARAVAAVFLLVVPALIAADSGAVLWILVGCVTVSGGLGLLVLRRVRSRLA